jgi:hypothetical protein
MIIRPAAISAMASSTVPNGGRGDTTRGWSVIFFDRLTVLERVIAFGDGVFFTALV